MKSIFYGLMIAIATLWGHDVRADSSLDGVASLIDKDAFVLGCVDVVRFDAEVLFRTAETGWESRRFRKMQESIGEGMKDLRNEGVRQAYFAASMRDLRRGPYFLLTFEQPPSSARRVLEMLEEQGLGLPSADFDSAVVGNVVVIGPKATVDRVVAGDAKPSPERIAEMNAAWDATEESSLRVAFLPSEDTRIALRQLAPPLPDDLRRFGMKDVLDGARWASLGIGTDRESKIRLTIQSKNAAAAETMADIVDTAGDMFFKQATRSLGPEAVLDLVAARKMIMPQQSGNQLVARLSGDQIQTIKKLIVNPMRQQAERTQEVNKLKQIALAMLNFESAYTAYPPHASYSKSGKPMLSWRVYILPYTEHAELYNKFRLDEPWDSPHNRKLIPEMPPVFSSSEYDLPIGKTVFQVPFGKETVFFGRNGTRLREISDGTSRTLLCVRVAADQAVEWTKPSDWEVDFEQPFRGLIDEDGKFVACRCDGSVSVFQKKDLKPEQLKAMLTKAGGEL